MEYFDIVDEQGQPTGRICSRSEAHGKGLPHRTAHIWIAGSKDGAAGVLLQKRALTKESFPGAYDTSSAGHMQAGDAPKQAALRELWEELGIGAAEDELEYLGMIHNEYRKVFGGKAFHDNEYIFIYRLKKEVDEKTLSLQKEEVDSVAWFSIAEVAERLAAGDPAFCVSFGSLQLLRDSLQKPAL